MNTRIHAVQRVAATAFLIVFPQATWAFRDGPPPGRTGSPGSGGATCRSCHGVDVGAGSVTILGAPLHYQSDAVYDITIRVSDPNQFGAGFQLSVEDVSGNPAGTLLVIDSVNTQLNSSDSGWINHTKDGVDNSVVDWAANGNSAEFAVRWQAPSSDVGAITFWAAGNAIDNNHSLTGDFVYLANRSATFVQVPAVSEWGIVILMLCLLTAGTLALLRPRRIEEVCTR